MTKLDFLIYLCKLFVLLGDVRVSWNCKFRTLSTKHRAESNALFLHFNAHFDDSLHDHTATSSEKGNQNAGFSLFAFFINSPKELWHKWCIIEKPLYRALWSGKKLSMVSSWEWPQPSNWKSTVKSLTRIYLQWESTSHKSLRKLKDEIITVYLWKRVRINVLISQLYKYNCNSTLAVLMISNAN